jgi:hypothetical protein
MDNGRHANACIYAHRYKHRVAASLTSPYAVCQSEGGLVAQGIVRKLHCCCQSPENQVIGFTVGEVIEARQQWEAVLQLKVAGMAHQLKKHGFNSNKSSLVSTRAFHAKTHAHALFTIASISMLVAYSDVGKRGRDCATNCYPLRRCHCRTSPPPSKPAFACRHRRPWTWPTPRPVLSHLPPADANSHRQ